MNSKTIAKTLFVGAVTASSFVGLSLPKPAVALPDKAPKSRLYILGDNGSLISLVIDTDITRLGHGLINARRIQVQSHYNSLPAGGPTTFSVETDTVDCGTKTLALVNAVFYDDNYHATFSIDGTGDQMRAPTATGQPAETTEAYFVSFACKLAAKQPVPLTPIQEYTATPMYWDLARSVQAELKREGVY